MPAYGQHSLEVQKQMHSDLVKVFQRVLSLGYDHRLEEAFRTKVRQHQMVVEGKSKVDYPTVHNTRPSWAADVYPCAEGIVEFGNTPEEVKQCHHFAGYVMGVADEMYRAEEISHILRNGDDWDMDKNINDQTFMDICHFELIKNPGDVLNYFET